MEEQRNLFEEVIIEKFEQALKEVGFVDPIVEVFYGTKKDIKNKPFTYVCCRFVFNNEFTYERYIGENVQSSTVEALLFDTYCALDVEFAKEAKQELKDYLFKKTTKTI